MPGPVAAGSPPVRRRGNIFEEIQQRLWRITQVLVVLIHRGLYQTIGLAVAKGEELFDQRLALRVSDKGVGTEIGREFPASRRYFFVTRSVIGRHFQGLHD